MKSRITESNIVAASTALMAALVLAAPIMAGASPQKHPPMHKTAVSAHNAEQTALKRFPGKLAGKTALENEEGKWQFAVMVRSGKTLREVMVNANTGKIDNVEVTSAAKESKEKAADAAKARKMNPHGNHGSHSAHNSHGSRGNAKH